MLTLVSKDLVKISDHFDVLCVLIARMVLEIINQMSKNQKSSLIVWNTVVASRMASKVISEHIPGKAHPQVPNGLCTHSTNLNCLLPSLVSGRPTIQVIDRLQYAKMEEEGGPQTNFT